MEEHGQEKEFQATDWGRRKNAKLRTVRTKDFEHYFKELYKNNYEKDGDKWRQLFAKPLNNQILSNFC